LGVSISSLKNYIQGKLWINCLASPVTALILIKLHFKEVIEALTMVLTKTLKKFLIVPHVGIRSLVDLSYDVSSNLIIDTNTTLVGYETTMRSPPDFVNHFTFVFSHLTHKMYEAQAQPLFVAPNKTIFELSDTFYDVDYVKHKSFSVLTQFKGAKSTRT
jgi:hypothetical protein